MSASVFIQFFAIAAGFALIALASKDIGRIGTGVGLPKISGFIFTGVLVGPHVLGFVGDESLGFVRIIDSIALPFIAFAAGSELHLEEIRRRLKSILVILSCVVLVVCAVGTLVVIALRDWIPFAEGKPFSHVVAIGLLAGSILVAKSPSSIVAIVKELRAKGVFTQTVLGVTVLLDAIVIILFAINSSIAGVLLKGTSFDVLVIVFLISELILNIGIGLLLAQVIRLFLFWNVSPQLKSVLVLFVGYLTATSSLMLREVEIAGLPMHIFSEPLLICMVAGFYLANYTAYADEFVSLLEYVAMFVFVLFFTGLGVALDLEVLKAGWMIAVVLVVTRIISMYFGCFIGGVLTGFGKLQTRLLGFTFITQAGIGLSLAKEVEVAFPEWGGEFATLLIAVIVVNTMIGPTFAKWALLKVGESHQRGDSFEEATGSRRALIVGVENQSLALEHLLTSHDWSVKLADIEATRIEKIHRAGGVVHALPEITKEALTMVGADRAETVVLMLDSDTNYQICEILYEHFGTENIIVRLDAGSDAARFYELGAVVVDPNRALVNLLDHYVRSPSSVSLLLGQVEDKDVVEFEVTNPALHGLPLRSLHLPSETLILAIRRKGSLILSHGYTRLRLGDEVTVVGTTEDLDEVQSRFQM